MEDRQEEKEGRKELEEKKYNKKGERQELGMEEVKYEGWKEEKG